MFMLSGRFYGGTLPSAADHGRKNICLIFLRNKRTRHFCPAEKTAAAVEILLFFLLFRAEGNVFFSWCAFSVFFREEVSWKYIKPLWRKSNHEKKDHSPDPCFLYGGSPGILRRQRSVYRSSQRKLRPDDRKQRGINRGSCNRDSG